MPLNWTSLVRPSGFEPETCGLRVRCSAVELEARSDFSPRSSGGQTPAILMWSAVTPRDTGGVTVKGGGWPDQDPLSDISRRCTRLTTTAAEFVER